MTISLLHPADYYPLLDVRQAPSLVIFTAAACGACRRLRQVLRAMAPIEGLAVYEVDAERAAGLIEELEIFHLPALFLYQDGELHTPVHASLQPAALAAAIAEARLAPAAIQ